MYPIEIIALFFKGDLLKLNDGTHVNAARLSLPIFNPNLIIIFTIIYVYVRRIDMKALTNMNIL